MAKSEYTLHIRYRTPGGTATHTRRIPWRWQPSTDDVIHSVRRLREQYSKVEVLGATLTQEVLIERFKVTNPEEVYEPSQQSY